MIDHKRPIVPQPDWTTQSSETAAFFDLVRRSGVLMDQQTNSSFSNFQKPMRQNQVTSRHFVSFLSQWNKEIGGKHGLVKGVEAVHLPISND